MMSDIILGLVILALLAYNAYTQYHYIREREKLMKMFLARNLKEVTENEHEEKVTPSKPAPPPDMVPISAEDETIFDKHIKKVLEEQENAEPLS